MEKRLSKNLEFLRKRRGLRKNKIAKSLGIPPSTWQGYESGSSNPTANRLAIMAAYFDVPENDLMYKDLSENNVEEEGAPYNLAKELKAENKALKNENKLLTELANSRKNELESQKLEILSLRRQLNELKK
jgi:transcriptional regulator with XRE-family HTH domain